MYIDRKGWDIPEINVNVNMYKETVGDKITNVIDRDILCPYTLEEDKKGHLSVIAKQCPVSKILEGDIRVRIFLFNGRETEKKIKYANNEITVL